MNKALKRYPKRPWPEVEPKRYKTRRALRLIATASVAASVASQVSSIMGVVAKDQGEKSGKSVAISEALINGQKAILNAMKDNYGIR